jgi:hypothetical protein
MIKKFIGRIRDRILPSKVIEKVSIAEQKAEQEKKQFRRQAEAIARYIYLNPGLNRHERRSLHAKIARSRRFHGRKQLPNVLAPGERKIAGQMLRATPTNIPATTGRLIENSALRRAGHAIKVYALGGF